MWEFLKSDSLVFKFEFDQKDFDFDFLIAKNGLIKGGDLDNAIVLVDKPLPQEKLDEIADLLGKPHIKVEEAGVLNNLKLHFQNPHRIHLR